MNDGKSDDANYGGLSQKESEHGTASESQLSMRHLTEQARLIRSSNSWSTLANLLNYFIGITIISMPHAVSKVGFIGGFLGVVFLTLLSLASAYLLIKARNRFKREGMRDLIDLARVTYGEKMALLC